MDTTGVLNSAIHLLFDIHGSTANVSCILLLPDFTSIYPPHMMATSGLIQQAKAIVSEATVSPQVLVLVAVLAVTAVYFGRPRKEGDLPTWIPLEIGAVGYAIQSGGPLLSLYTALRRNGGSLFGLTSTHQVLHKLPNVDRFMAQGHGTLDMLPRDWAMSWRVFGCDKTERLRLILEDATPSFNSIVEKSFVNEANSTAAIERSDIPARAHSFVTFSTSPDTLAYWERDAKARLVAPDAVEAELLSLMRDFGACISVPQLYGQDFMDRNPTLLADLWKFDNNLFPLLMIGLPTWLPIQAMKEGLAARKRLHVALEGLYKRIDQYRKGEPVDFGADMSDISPVALGRSEGYTKRGLSYRHQGQLDMGLFWGQNGNTQPLVFWFLLFTYATPGLVDDLRKELAPYIPISKETGQAKITNFDLRALSHKCPLLKSTMYETFRMANQPTSIRLVKKSITISDGERKHQAKKGSWISAAWSLTNRDPSIYDDPETFKPDRFIETDPETKTRTARYGPLRPWGNGPGICKGRTFAEKEILGLGAAIVSLWDISPAGGDGKTWEIPSMLPGTGAVLPDREVRVVVRRRVL